MKMAESLPNRRLTRLNRVSALFFSRLLAKSTEQIGLLVQGRQRLLSSPATSVVFGSPEHSDAPVTIIVTQSYVLCHGQNE
jgi:hypothetical protein